MADFSTEQLSDDEDVFFGKMTLKEVKKHIWLNHGKRMSNIRSQEPSDISSPLKIIESHSQPNLQSTLSLEATRDNRKSEESFVRIENMIAKMCVSPEKELELNNTLEIVDYILNNGPNQESTRVVKDVNFQEIGETDSASSQLKVNIKKEIEILVPKLDPLNEEESKETNLLHKEEPIKVTEVLKDIHTQEMVSIISQLNSDIKKGSPVFENMIHPHTETSKDISNLQHKENPINEIKPKKNLSSLSKLDPKKELAYSLNTEVKNTGTPVSSPVRNEKKLKVENNSANNSPKFYTPGRSPRKPQDVFQTPSTNMLKPRTPMFKTPGNPFSVNKSSVVLTPSKSPMYKNIKSPIASYIKGSIEVPMVSNVCPKKPLPGMSMIPKLVKSSYVKKIQNKENIKMPTTVYKSAKKTKVVQVPNKEKPQSYSAQKLLARLPHPPIILKHETREFSSVKKLPLNLLEDSVADLSGVQADVSVCTQIKPKHKY